jgi:signal transduction histidine kinase
LLVPRRPVSKVQPDNAAAGIWVAAAHDLRQPLQSLALTSRILALDRPQIERQTAVRNLGLALASFDDMLVAVIELAGLTSGTRRPELASVALARIIETVVGECGPAASAAGITLDHVSLTTAIHTDPRLLAKILKALVLYAIKYGTGDRIVIEAGKRGKATAFAVTYAGPHPGGALKHQAFIELGPLGADPSRPVQGLGLAFAAQLAGCLGFKLEPGRTRDGSRRLSLNL